MTLLRWNKPAAAWPLTELNRLQDEVARLFEQPFARAIRPTLFDQWSPVFDLYEDRDNLILKAELPGLKKEDIELSLHDGALVIAGERKLEQAVEHSEVVRSERHVGRFQRSLTLPVPVNADKVKAAYENGILTVTLPKAEEAKPRQITVEAK
jgi:HSP20 family protein